MDVRNSFFKIVTPENLYLAALIFCIITIVSVSLIYYTLYHKKKQSKDLKEIDNILDQWISEALVDDSQEFTHKYIVSDLLDYLYKEKYRQFTIQKLINSQISLKGLAANHIVSLYKQLNLHHDSINKLHSSQWDKKAQGIYELYMMYQTEYKDEIKAETNNKNEFIRMEAQIGVVTFEGFRGLDFLNTLTRPLTEWQQLKILDQLQTIQFEPMENINSWIESHNKYVCLFGMRLAEIYQQYQCNTTIQNILAATEDEKIKLQAVRSLGKLALDNTSEILKTTYFQSSTRVKIEVLKALSNIGDSEDLLFLQNILINSKDSIKIEATRAIFSCNRNKEEVIKELSGNKHVPNTILDQVIYENNQ